MSVKCLESILALASTTKRIGKTILNAISRFETRQGEYLTSSISSLCYLFSAALKDGENAIVFNMTPKQQSAPLIAMPMSSGPLVLKKDPQVLASHQPQAMYQTYQQPQLIDTLVARDSRINDLQQLCKAHVDTRRRLSQDLVRARMKIDQLERQLAKNEPTDQAAADLSVVSCTAGNSRLALKGMLALGLLRNMSNCACQDLGAIL